MNLRKLTKTANCYWGAEEREFICLKTNDLKTIMTLGYFCNEEQMDLIVDAFPSGLGAVLVQYDNSNIPRIISCVSKALPYTEKRYPQTQKRWRFFRQQSNFH